LRPTPCGILSPFRTVEGTASAKALGVDRTTGPITPPGPSNPPAGRCVEPRPFSTVETDEGKAEETLEDPVVKPMLMSSVGCVKAIDLSATWLSLCGDDGVADPPIFDGGIG
jgi:hypothetical protein